MGKLLKMAWRNVWRNWRRTVIAVIAIALGLAFILLFDGMLGGMDEALHGKQVRLQGGHVQVHAPGFREKMNRSPLLPLANPDALVQAAQAQPEAVAVTQRIKTGGIVSSREPPMPVASTSERSSWVRAKRTFRACWRVRVGRSWPWRRHSRARPYPRWPCLHRVCPFHKATDRRQTPSGHTRSAQAPPDRAAPS